MPIVQTITCDAPNCGKDVTQGAGRMWRMQAYKQVVPINPASTPRVDAGDVASDLVRLCDHRCLADWAAAQASIADTAQAAYAAQQAAAKQAAVAMPSPAPTPAQPA